MHQSEVKEVQRVCPLRGTRAWMRAQSLLRAQATAVNSMLPCRSEESVRATSDTRKSGLQKFQRKLTHSPERIFPCLALLTTALLS
jgi:hypothetical protein